MADFEKAFKITSENEGGYVNDKDDPGGETVFGITRRDFPHSPLWTIIDRYKKEYGMPKAITFINKDTEAFAIAKSIYKGGYWNVNRLGDLDSQEIANQLFDIGVNMGTGRAAEFLQEAVNTLCDKPELIIDRKIGPKTIEAVNSNSACALYAIINKKRENKYNELIAGNPALGKFKKSWFSRIKPFEQALS